MDNPLETYQSAWSYYDEQSQDMDDLLQEVVLLICENKPPTHVVVWFYDDEEEYEAHIPVCSTVVEEFLSACENDLLYMADLCWGDKAKLRYMRATKQLIPIKEEK